MNVFTNDASFASLVPAQSVINYLMDIILPVHYFRIDVRIQLRETISIAQTDIRETIQRTSVIEKK